MKYTKEVLTKAISENHSMAGVMRTLGARQSGGLHYHLLLRAREWGIDMSHFAGQAGGSNKAKSERAISSLDSICIEHSDYNRGRLKKRLIDNGMLKKECRICGQQPEWNGMPLVMVLDHINGERDDNRIENLRLLCPHCNSQQSTFCRKKSSLSKRMCTGCGKTIAKRNKSGFCSRCLFVESFKKIECPVCGKTKNVGRKACDQCLKREGRVPELAAGVEIRTPCESLVGSNPTTPTNRECFCPECGRVKTDRAPRCRSCAHKKNRKIERPPWDELDRMIREMPMVAIARKYGVSDNAVRKWVRR